MVSPWLKAIAAKAVMTQSVCLCGCACLWLQGVPEPAAAAGKGLQGFYLREV